MAEFSKLIITDAGRALLAKMISGSGNIEFTNVSASCTEYTDAELGGLTSLSDVKQTSRISKVTRTNEVAVKVEAAFTNKELTEGYYMKALGLYAVDPDAGEILYAVTRETSGNCHMPAYNGATVSGAYIQLVTTVGTAENVSLEVDSGAYATMGDIRTLEEKIGELNEQLNKCFGSIDTSGDIGFAEGIESDNIVDAINEVFQSGSEKKQRLVSNLIAMGIQADTSETWEALLDKVLDMTDTSEDTVTSAALLDGYTAHDATGGQITGDMPELASTTVDTTGVTQDDEYTYLGVPAGHYNENSKVRAINSDLKSGLKTFYLGAKTYGAGYSGKSDTLSFKTEKNVIGACGSLDKASYNSRTPFSIFLNNELVDVQYSVAERWRITKIERSGENVSVTITFATNWGDIAGAGREVQLLAVCL